MGDIRWRKSSYSKANGNCVEAAGSTWGVLARDSKDQDGPVLTFGAPTWEAFTSAVKSGDAP